MILEILKNKEKKINTQKISQKKYFGVKENVELNRINKRSVLENDQEKVQDILYNPKEDSSIFQSDKKRFISNFEKDEKKDRKKNNKRNNNIIEKSKIHHLKLEKNKWDMMNKEYNTQKIKIENKKDRRLERAFFDSQGFNVINMKYDETVSGDILKKRDEKMAQNRFRRAENLFNRNNTNYDIFTGKDKNFKTFKKFDDLN